MKFLIQNYATSSFTEPLYMCEAINNTTTSDCTMWSNDISAFDIFDIVKPDIFLTHFSMLGNDSLKYLSENKDISLILNVTSASKEHLRMLDDIIVTNGINCPFIFTNQPSQLQVLSQEKTKLINIMHGADIFLVNQQPQKMDYKIETAIVTNHKPQGSAGFNTYHLFSHEETLADSVDIVAPAMNLFSLYGNYERVIVAQDSEYMPQSFFDAILYGNQAYYYCGNPNHVEKMKEVTRSLFPKSNLIWDGNNKETGSSRKTLLEKHTCLNRAKRLIKQLKCGDTEKEIDTLIEGNKNDHSIA